MDDLDLEKGLTSSQVRKNISLKLKGRKKQKLIKKEDEGEEICKLAGSGKEEAAKSPSESLPIHFSSLRTNNEPLHHNQPLQWNQKLNLIGMKVVNPSIHCCMQCLLPILKYGRMMPCKHVACHDCASKYKVCPKCEEKVEKIMEKELSSIFMCTHGGTKHGIGGCGKTYFSLRDLRAHMDHRHSRNPPATKDPRMAVEAPPPHKSPPQPAPSSIPVVSTRTSNLITVPIQDDYQPTYPTASSAAQFLANFSQPPPINLYNTPPPLLRPHPYVGPNLPPPPHHHPWPRHLPPPGPYHHRPYYH